MYESYGMINNFTELLTANKRHYMIANLDEVIVKMKLRKKLYLCFLILIFWFQSSHSMLQNLFNPLTKSKKDTFCT